MTAGQSTGRISTVSLAPGLLAALLAAMLFTGTVIGAAITQLAWSDSAAEALGAAPPAVTYDAVQSQLDAVKLRADERAGGLHDAISTQLDAVKLKADERGAGRGGSGPVERRGGR